MQPEVDIMQFVVGGVFELYLIICFHNILTERVKRCNIMFHEKLQRLRKEKGLSQEDLADMLGVSRQAVSKWESGYTYPETDKLIALSDILGVTVDSLLKDNEPQNADNNYDGKTVYVPYMVPGMRSFEYKSKRTYKELPLVHIHFGFGAKKAKGIVAIGNIAHGVVAIGLLSMGLVSIGLLSLGLISIGLLALGLLAIGSISTGVFSIGAVAFGVFTLGAVSIGVYSTGAVAVASRVAVGNHAYAPIAIGRVVEGARTFIVSPFLGDGSTFNSVRDFTTVCGSEVRQAILEEYPNTREWIIRWMTRLLG